MAYECKCNIAGNRFALHFDWNIVFETIEIEMRLPNAIQIAYIFSRQRDSHISFPIWKF